MAWRFFEDLEPGETRASPAESLSAADILAFAWQFDPQWFHADADAAGGSVFGGLVAAGTHALALWRRLDHAINGDIAWVCGVAWEDVRFERALRPDEPVRATSRLLAKRPSASRDDRGVVEMACALELADGSAAILRFRSINLCYRRSAKQAAMLESLGQRLRR
jgi:acyl dehydratase